jgi:PAS domain S-box-containing protein
LVKKGDSRISELAFLLNNISHAILFESLNNEILFINQNFCDLFEIPVQPEHLFGADCSQAAKESCHLFKEPQRFIDDILLTYQNKEPVLNEELILADGRMLYRDYKPILHHPVFSGHLWVYKNSLELKSILNEVQEQRKFYEDLLNNIPADIAIFDKNHKYLFVNKLALSKNDTRKWLIGKDDFEYCKRTNKSDALAISRRASFTEAINKGDTVEFEEIGFTKEGAKVFNLRRFYPLKTEDGSIEYVIGYGINISKIREREEALLHREQAFRDLVESIDQLVVIVNEAGYIQYLNSQWVSLTGMDAEECLHKKIGTFIKAGKASFTDNVNLFINEGKYKTDKRRVGIINKQGKKHTLTYYISGFTNLQAVEKRFAIFFNDITIQLSAENELKKIARQERKLNELKSNFIGLVSHELRTPLSVILSNAELIEIRNAMRKEGQPPETEVYTKRIIEQVDKMTELMNDFLLLSKIESGKIPVNISNFDIRQLIYKLRDELYSPWKDERSLEVSVKGNPVSVTGDEAMIMNVLINIINNAFKYSKGTSAPKLRLRFNARLWQITLIDFGIGISEEDKKNLFHPFVRGSNVGDIEGTGLGLMVVKFFVKKNRGSMFMKSILHKGTAIVLQFPY